MADMTIDFDALEAIETQLRQADAIIEALAHAAPTADEMKPGTLSAALYLAEELIGQARDGIKQHARKAEARP